MTDAESSKIDVFGTTYSIDGDTIQIHLQLSASHARNLDAHFDECISLQEAIRKSSGVGVCERRETLTVSNFERQRESIDELAGRSEAILDRLDTIADALSSD